MRGTVSFSQSIIHVGLFQASSSKHLSKLYKLQPFVDLTNGSKLGNKVQILTKKVYVIKLIRLYCIILCIIIKQYFGCVFRSLE